MVLVLQAHPYPDRSRANKALARAIQGLEGLEIRSLYDLYPDYAIDVESEQAALLRADTIVWQHPLYWYSAPALMKLWFEKVLAHGWAYGPGGNALHGKRCLWAVTAGAGEHAYSASGMHQYPFDAFVPVMQQTAQFCGMRWLDPVIVLHAHEISREQLDGHAEEYRSRLVHLIHEDAQRHA